MFGPSDTELEVFREGDESTVPGAPTGGPMGEAPYQAYHSLPHHLPNMCAIFEVVCLVGGEDQRIWVDDRPDYWLVTQTGTATAETGIWPYEVAAGDQIRLGPTGRHVIPGLGGFLVLRAIGAATSTLTVIAVRGYPLASLSWG